MNPASTMKLVTTYSALHLLGPAFTFRTEVLSEAPLIGEVLRGDLYVRGGGDPKLVIEDLWLLVSRLRGFGIREIRGDLVLDKTLLRAAAHTTRREFDGEEGRAYNVGPDALLVNFKSIAITLVPDTGGEGGARRRRARSRRAQGAAHACRRSRAAAATGAARLRADINDPMNIRLRGVYPLACGERAIYLGALEHTNYFAAVFRALWERQGGAWTGKVREGDGARDRRGSSPRRNRRRSRMLIRDINKFSQQRDDAAAVPDHGRGRRASPAIRHAAAPRCATCCRRAASRCRGWCSKTAAACRASSASPPARSRDVLARCLEEPVDGRAHVVAAHLGRGRHHEGAQRAGRRRAHEDRACSRTPAPSRVMCSRRAAGATWWWPSSTTPTPPRDWRARRAASSGSITGGLERRAEPL